MKFAYIILAHKFPEQLNRLISCLDDKENTFIVHLCRNTSEVDFKKVHQLLDGKGNILFCKREDGSWGEFGIVQAVLNGMLLLKKKNISYDYLHVLSGSDYPIKSNQYLRNFFSTNRGKQFLWYLPIYDYEPFPMLEGSIYGEGWRNTVHPWNNRFLRIEKYWYSLLKERLMVIPETRFLDKPIWNVIKIFLYNVPQYNRENRLKREFLLMLLSLTHKKKRSIPHGYLPYAGSQWFSITKDCSEYILDTHRKRPDLKKHFEHTLLPDETFFTTILVHSPYKQQMAQTNMRFIKWEGKDRSHPMILTEADFQELKKSNKLFARKFDEAKDPRILDLIDSEMLDM